MAKENFCVARIETRTRASVGKFERHIERKNESYENMNVDLTRTPMNVSFKGCGELTYNEQLDKMIADGAVSLKGLRPDANVFDEMILDVNTDYFERSGGYEYACRFYEAAFHFAERIYGRDNIISAVMHADELNLAVSEKYGRRSTTTICISWRCRWWIRRCVGRSDARIPRLWGRSRKSFTKLAIQRNGGLKRRWMRTGNRF